MNKRILSLALLISILLSFTSVSAEEPKGNKGTFYGFTYSSAYDFDNIVKPVNLTSKMIDERGVAAVAKEIGEKLKRLPEGRRCLDIVHLINKTFSGGKVNWFFQGNNVTDTSKLVDAFFAELKKNNIPVDYVVDDYEETFTMYAFENDAIGHYRNKEDSLQDSIAKNGALYEEYIKKLLIDFENHPTYEEQLKPKLESAGFVFSENYDLEYVNLHLNALEPRRTKFLESNPPDGAENSAIIFDECVGELFDEAYNKAVLEPIKKHYPNIKLTNYGSQLLKGGYNAYTAWGLDRRLSKSDSSTYVGTHTSPVVYGKYKAIRYIVPKGYPYDVYRATAFNVMLLEKQYLDSNLMGSASKGAKTMPWVGLKTWSDYYGVDDPNNGVYHNFKNTNYYEEMIFHVGMTNPDPFQIFDVGGADETKDVAILSKIFNQLDELVGFDDREPIVPLLKNATKIDQRYLLSGMSAGGRNVWRITPDLYTPGVSISNFKVSDSPLKFQIGNQFVEFPAGSYILEPSEKLSDYGYWVVSPKGTRPSEYRDSSLPEPDEPVETADHFPSGYLLEAQGTGKRSDLFEDGKSDVNDDIQEPQDAVITKTKLAVSPINYKGKNVPLVTKSIPNDIQGHWSENSISNLFALGIINGSNVGIEPDKYVTMAEFVAMLMRMLTVEPQVPDGEITGIDDNAWYKNEMYTALVGEWIEQEDIEKSSTPLNREKAILILYNAANSLIKDNGTEVEYSDNYRISQSCREAVRILSAAGIIKGYPDNEFKPKSYLTRAESALVFENFLLYVR